ncbi:membrane protein [Streptomyces phage Success]|uniref:Membrane protein n=1 Tax=Streptomyces phage Success TaxID=2999013 RepID=A0A9E8M5K0_9CAUD|nr:membrane protein [Streptomyces phage Success]WAB08865.1 membrane protein [Streptomyces phage Success]
MRTLASALLAALLGAAIASGVTFHHMRGAVLRMEVDAFNDGFVDGSCHNGADGFGHICR